MNMIKLVLCILNEFVELSLFCAISMIKSIFIIILNTYFLFKNNLQASERSLHNHIDLIKKFIVSKILVLISDIDSSYLIIEKIKIYYNIHLYSAHKNVKAIWTHGGLLSTQEAIWKGVPVIGMPFFMDQKPNVEILVQKGAGVRLDFKTLSTESVSDALEKVLYNERYGICTSLVLIILFAIYL